MPIIKADKKGGQKKKASRKSVVAIYLAASAMHNIVTEGRRNE